MSMENMPLSNSIESNHNTALYPYSVDNPQNREYCDSYLTQLIWLIWFDLTPRLISLMDMIDGMSLHLVIYCSIKKRKLLKSNKKKKKKQEEKEFWKRGRKPKRKKERWKVKGVKWRRYRSSSFLKMSLILVERRQLLRFVIKAFSSL